jgi:peptidyl-prolyl cis-trans isomerase A (cyclophilin A)
MALKYRHIIISAIFISLSVLLIQCGQRQQAPAPTEDQSVQTDEEPAKWQELLSSVVTINTFDGNRILEIGQGFFVDSSLVVTRLSLMNAANRALVFPHDSQQGFEADGFVVLDRISDLIVLKVSATKRSPLKLYTDSVPNSAKTFIVTKPSGGTLQLRTGRVESLTNKTGLPLYQVSNQILKSSFGVPLFLSNQQVLGIGLSEVIEYKQRSLAIPAWLISSVVEKAGEVVRPLSETQSHAGKTTSDANSRIRGILISTDYGNITIRLFNETPDYRDNFIRLADEGFYDSLLVHRVIAGLGMQSGAADTRYAQHDDVVGWKGPGYTMPAHIVPGKFHQRGMVGSPRRPDTENVRRRSEGSQYYIVSGRKYSDRELDEIQKETGHTFTSQQRQVYKTIGGAPHLDGSYTIFGEVLSGIGVVDEISKVEVGREFRPVKDIRVRKVTVLR